MEWVELILFVISIIITSLILTASFLGAVIFMLLRVNIQDFFGDDDGKL